jgi:hypothetical protein
LHLGSVGYRLKVVLHRGHAVRQTVGSGWDLPGPAVTTAYRLLKNAVREQIGNQPCVFVTDAAAAVLGSPDVGRLHREELPDVESVDGRVRRCSTNPGNYS